MTRKEQIINWITIGLSQSVDRFSEIFYFDRRDNEFFSILVTDYFMFEIIDEKFVLADNVTVNYSSKTLKVLVDRVNRIEENDVNILSLPRFGKIDAGSTINRRNEFLESNQIDIETVSIWEVEENGDISINLKE